MIPAGVASSALPHRCCVCCSVAASIARKPRGVKSRPTHLLAAAPLTTSVVETGEKIAKLSKKEEQARLEAKRNKQGIRTAKTGSRRRKFDPEAAEEGKKLTKAQQKKNVDNSRKIDPD